MPRADAPIFITGSGRCGTTLLRGMLNAHPDVHLANEANHYLLSSALLDRWPRLWLAWYARSMAFHLQGFTARQAVDLLAEAGRERRLRDAFLVLLQGRARLQAPSATVVGDKTPGACPAIGRMLRDFPQARIIHMVRSPLDTVPSLAAMPWAPASLLLNAWYVRRQDAHASRHAGRVLDVRLEDLIDDPEATVTRIGRYLGLDGLRADRGRVSDLPALPWLQAVRFPITRRARASALTDAQRVLIYRIARPVFVRHGYAPPAGAVVPAWRVVLECARGVPGALIDVGRMARTAWRNLVGTAAEHPDRFFMRSPRP